jgi:hypothetical protein
VDPVTGETRRDLAAYFEEARWRDYVESLTEIYRARRDTMLDALAEHFPPQAEWTRPGGGLFIWATLPDFIDTTDLLARALQENVAFVPGEAAFLDGRGRAAMRLNFSGSDEDAIREGIRRIGEVVTEQRVDRGQIAELHTESVGTSSRRSAVSEPAARSPTSSTASWSIFSGSTPAAMLVTTEIPRQRMPMCRAAMTSCTVDMPARSPPAARMNRISAGVSNCGPGNWT